MPYIIKFDERYNEFKKLLYDFDYKIIANTSQDDLYQLFRQAFDITSKDTKMNCWYRWTKSVIDAAKFINNFKSCDG